MTAIWRTPEREIASTLWYIGHNLNNASKWGRVARAEERCRIHRALFKLYNRLPNSINPSVLFIITEGSAVETGSQS